MNIDLMIRPKIFCEAGSLIRLLVARSLSQNEGSVQPQEDEQDGDLGGVASSGANLVLDETDVSFNIIGQVLGHP